MENKAERKIYISTTIMLILLAILITYTVMTVKAQIDEASVIEKYAETYGVQESNNDLKKLKRALGIIERDYLKEYDNKELEEGAIRGMLDALGDPYTSYFDKSETEEFLTETVGDYEGVGLYVSCDLSKETVIVLLPIEGSPAYEAGIKPGDYIVEIDGENVVGVSLEEVAAKLKGPKNSTVKVKIVRYDKDKNAEEIEKVLTRRKIELSPLKYEVLENNIGYISIASFDENATRKFQTALNELLNKKNVSGLIIDVRNNPGGLLNVATEMIDLLLPEGKIVITKDKNGKEETVMSDKKSVAVPIVILVNENSASAAEIMAAAIKDFGGTVVGKTTYGKGLIQEFKNLLDGTYVKVTIGEYFSPNGNKINEVGVEPNIEVEDDYATDVDEQLQEAIEALK